MSRTSPHKLLTTAILATAALLLGAGPASAAWTPSISGTGTMTAGGHDDLSITVNLPSSGAKVQDIDLALPPGVIGDPNAVTPCTLTQANAKSCPDSSKVGTVLTVADAVVPGMEWLPMNDLGVWGSIYVMQPRGSEPARLFTRIGSYVNNDLSIEPIIMESPIRLDSPGSYSLVTELRNIPTTTIAYPWQNPSLPVSSTIRMKSMTMNLWGTRVSMTKPFLTAPTNCTGTVRYGVSAKGYGAAEWASASSQNPITVTGCNAPDFTPSMVANTNAFTADAPSAVSVTVGFPAPGTGIAQSTVKSTQFILPEGFAISAGSGAGLAGCTDEQFAAATAAQPACDPKSKIGTVSFSTPLIPNPIEGDVYIGFPRPGAPLRMLIHAAAPGPIVLKLQARAVPDPVTGQVTTVFDDIPPIPFTAFTMNFRGGDNAMIKAPTGCGSGSAIAKMEPSARPGTFVDAAAVLTTSGCQQLGFSPQIDMALGGLAAAGDSSMALTFTRTDADQRFGSMRMSLPPGMLGRLSSVVQCPIDQARAGNCSEASKVGTVNVTSGTGNAPLPLSGDVFLTSGFDGGVAGLAIIVNAKVGPIDLGVVPVIAKMTVRSDMGIDVVSEPIPSIVGGVPLFVRTMSLDLNRSGFLFNASSCEARTITAQLGSLNGATIDTSIPYTPTGCAALPFAPAFSASLTGDLNKPGLTAKMAPRPGDSTMASMAMTLPAPMGADMNAVGAACPEADFVANRCTKKAQIGTARAVSSIIDEPLTGPVYLVMLPGQVLPGLSVMLHGPIDVPVTIVNSTSGGMLTSTVRDIPDVPLSTFEMKLDAGRLLQTDRKALCAKKHSIKAVFTGHNGARSEATPPLTYDCNAKVLGPAPRAKATGSAKIRGKKVSLKVSVSGKQITGAKITLPKSGLKLRAKSVRNAAIVKSGSTMLHRSMVSAKGQVLTLKLPAAMKKAGVTKLSIDLSASAVGKAAKLKRGKTVTLTVRVTHKTGKATNLKLKIKVK